MTGIEVGRRSNLAVIDRCIAEVKRRLAELYDAAERAPLTPKDDELLLHEQEALESLYGQRRAILASWKL